MTCSKRFIRSEATEPRISPRLILSKNLFGLEIDDRAEQLAAFALMMKARADDRRIFDQGIQPHVRALIQTDGMDAEDIAAALNVSDSKESPPPGQLFETEDDLFTRATPTATRSPYISLTDVKAVVSQFEHAKTFGSLIQVPERLADRLPQMEARCRKVAGQTSEISSRTAAMFVPVIEQAKVLASKYDCVVANPPYMGTKYYNVALKSYINKHYKATKADLYACFIQKNVTFAKPSGFVGMITIPNWMFLSSFQEIRKNLFAHQTIDSFIHNGRGVFGSDFGSCSFVYWNKHLPDYRGTFRRLFERQGSVASNEELAERILAAKNYTPSNATFLKVPGSPITAYSLSTPAIEAFQTGEPLSRICDPRQGLATTDNARFVRLWWETSFQRIGFELTREEALGSDKRWFPFNKGGQFRKWFGNIEHVVDWKNDGEAIKSSIVTKYTYLNGDPNYVAKNQTYYFRQAITWTDITSSVIGFRLMDDGIIPSHVSHCAYVKGGKTELFLGMLNSPVVGCYISTLSPSVHFDIGYFGKIPFLAVSPDRVHAVVSECLDLARRDWNSFETSWGFSSSPVLKTQVSSLRHSQEACDHELNNRFKRMGALEEENNRLFIGAYGLQDELAPEVPDDQITLYRPNREEDVKRLISYALGCTMGRYSLDTPGFVYAQGGNVGFDPGQYSTFPADPDGIVPVMEADWFADDAANRFVEFLGMAWPKEGLDENLKFVADALGPNKGEQSRDTIRRYLATGFTKHHLQTYKRRPIYWLFSSGKQRAFQCLVYLHRYHDGTLARMRTEYVIPLQGKLASRIDQLASDILKATSTSHRKTLTQERDKLIKQQAELQSYDEKLRHYADMRITLDLDDGVKVNYGKFGDLLAEVKAVTGGREED